MTDDPFAGLAAEAELTRRLPAADPELAGEAAGWVHHEARLLDERRLLEWLGLCTDDVVHWVPADHDGGDPRTAVSIALDDRRRLEDRVHWILAGKSHAQQPPARTIRAVTNVEAWDLDSLDGATGPPGERLVRSTQVIHELRDAAPRQLVATVEHRWCPGPTGWRIRRKRVHLLDSDRHRWNATFVL